MSARRWAFVTASSGRCSLRRGLAAGCACRLHTPRGARTPPTRVAAAFRTAHLHSGPISRTKFECAFNAPINREGNFPTFSDPPNLGGVDPRRALQFCSSSWFGRPRRRWPRRRRPKRRRRSLFPHTGCVAVSVALRATRAHAWSGDIRLMRTVRCVGPPPCDCACDAHACACVRRGDGGDCVCVRIAVVAGSIDSTARSAMWSGGQVCCRNHMCTHERT